MVGPSLSCNIMGKWSCLIVSLKIREEKWDKKQPQGLPSGDPLLLARFYFPRITEPPNSATTWGLSVKTH